MAKAKPKSGVSGVYYRDDGRPRWEVKIRWTDRKLGKQSLTRRWPVDPKAARNSPTHVQRAKADAEAWATSEWRHLRAYDQPLSYQAQGWTLKTLLERYLAELEEGKIEHKSIKTEMSAVRVMLGRGKGHNADGFPKLIEKGVEDLEYSDFVGLGSDSLQSMLKDRDGNRASTSSLRRLLTVIRGVFIRAQVEWKIKLKNPLQSIKKLPVDDARERTVRPEEWEAILSELGKHEQGTQDAIAFARWTAARRSEVVKLDWSDINLAEKTAILRNTKSRGVDKVVNRTIPLPAQAMEILNRRAGAFTAPDSGGKPRRPGGPVFTTEKGARIRPDTLTQAWTRACARAGVEGARVHDLRHTRITELGRFLSAAEAARVSGHTDLATFFRYFNPDPVDTGKKIDAMEASNGAISERVQELARALTTLSPEDFAATIAKSIEMKSTSIAGR